VDIPSSHLLRIEPEFGLRGMHERASCCVAIWSWRVFRGRGRRCGYLFLLRGLSRTLRRRLRAGTLLSRPGQLVQGAEAKGLILTLSEPRGRYWTSSFLPGFECWLTDGRRMQRAPPGP